ncbi:MAG TPA: ankyrin repeat domain-containing protein [Nostocaceae cyanobacterium]|nr:ankyrin repeat domain-containing protein [Nostocaceae cyanobacterium]
MNSETTARIISQWYESIGQGDMEAIMNGLAEDIVFELPQNQYNKIIPYLGTHIGREQVAEAFRIRGEENEVLEYGVREVVAQGNIAFAVVYTKARQTRTNVVYEIEDSHRLVINENGQITNWKVYFDPNVEVAAYQADIEFQLITAVQNNNTNKTKELLELGANPNTRDEESGLTVLMMAAGQANTEITKLLLETGADVFTTDSRAGASALHKACQGGSVEVVQLLVEAGAFVDSVAATTGHTPLMDALWFKYPAIVEYLLKQGAGLNLYTHYGFSLMEHFQYELNVNVIGKDKLLEAEKMLQERQESDQNQVVKQKLMEAVTRKDLATVKQLIQSGVDIDERYPILNGFNDAHTPLLVAARDGDTEDATEIVQELLKAGADVNAVEPTFGAVPLHKAVYNGRAAITWVLVEQPGININFQGATNGYTPLHDALWHGYVECAEILLNAGARLDLKGHDGKTPLDIAIETLGPDHEIITRIKSKQNIA